MSDKRRVLKMTLPEISRNYLVVQDHRDLMEDLRIMKDEGNVNDKMIITVQEMTQDEIDNLDEFDGW